MNTVLLTVIQKMVAESGESVLADSRRVAGYLADFAAREPKAQRNTLVKCLEQGAYAALKRAAPHERGAVKERLARRLHTDEGFDRSLCEDSVNLLAVVLFGHGEAAAGETAAAIPSTGDEWVTVPEARKAALAQGDAGNRPIPQTAVARKERKRYLSVGIAASVLVLGLGVVFWMNRYNNAGNASHLGPTLDMVRIQGGTFTMGSPSSEPDREDDEVQHRVTLSSFYMGKYEVTQKEWQALMGTNPSSFKGDNLPVECVSWYDAVEYCNARSKKEGLTPAYTINKTRQDPNNTSSYDSLKWTVTWNRKANGYRLPTEAEWEYACRAGTTGPFNTGNNITTSQANYNGNYPYNGNAKGQYREKTTAVGSFQPNAWGLYDMHGNVWEWCWDWYGNYSSGAQTDPEGPTGPASSWSRRVRRGGSWYNSGQYLRSANRGYYSPGNRLYYLGFRLVRP
ncbi:MAG: formylglycine-generating enzyme family protein [Treponema sp.]|jgi:formylglycine-generating enzyme required for sulfatase activity|nr:formylglycine-generating enzyme family protein [Treponema sp.]